MQVGTLDESDARELCAAALRDPDELVVRFTVEDFALALIRAGLSEQEVLSRLRAVSVPGLGDALLEASGWQEIFAWF